MPSPFPVEIFEIIVALVPDHFQSLAALCLTSRTLASCAQQRLYQVYRTDRWHNVYPRFASFLDTIVRHPHLARRIRELVTPYADPCDPHLLIDALPLMTNLKSFTIFAYPTTYLDNVLQTLLHCSFQLVELRWNWVVKGPAPCSADFMTRFLSRQTHLRSLSLKMTPLSTPPKNSLPNLKALSTTCENIQTILPGRSIDTVDCFYLDADDPDFENMTPDSPLVAPFKAIKRLCLGIATLWYRNMGLYLSSLEVLQSSVIGVREYNLIPCLSHLRVIHITRDASAGEQAAMSKRLFSTLPRLEYVIWGSPFMTQSPVAQPRYACWSEQCFRFTMLDARQVHEQTGLLLLDRLLPMPSD